MAVKVLVVDDSSFFRRRVSEIINADSRLEVVGNAVNGKEAVELTQKLQPDVITMDIEMPVMDGITAVREIMKVSPTPILMFSSLTHDGAKATLDALDAGALDFLPKKFEDIARNRDEAVELLQKRVAELARKRIFMRRSATTRSTSLPSSPLTSTHTSTTKPTLTSRLQAEPSSVSSSRAARASVVKPALRFKASGKKYQIVAIGTSTGGPVALQKILTQLPANFPYPIVLIQHMPATFTAAFAARLDQLCKIGVKEAENGDMLKAGMAYLAPGGKQMMLDGRPGASRLRIIDSGERMNYKPCVDVTFGSAAKVYQDKVLSMVLTGMGADGRDGARMLKNSGSTIWAQDEDSCVVYGMPQAVAKAGISSHDLPLDRIAECMLIELGLQ
ncbi:MULTISPECIES: chemotaxis response regulator protein-glutamate methylesterase [unclassified Photobacterium]|uniref:protein-glutamate methylesterase/protein-glutamine glutaminase n=1 Tax=unclassified Photobacterium TaxID=2628852 RepID=UPI000D17E0B9|nr:MULTISPECIES: chemotaxis response regulator protein-glutamate methylesterase [unclassified Photobacterium]PSV28780.1 chemotaxis response regulator protein-glutamate methylesterase [Photobacterium sp. GB-56]PSV33370.1 chemotaxis response regulator protein-glutamate methylesterase [Photobacterium sp. GB-72]PSV39369.1 chemotaxis response regulator protein-glutamate methylesterase [Photobacterium sp. GB-27]PSV40670.1 chemotaxis response regulator protein-glutamate methylesterase [Photobacterium 